MRLYPQYTHGQVERLYHDLLAALGEAAREKHPRDESQQAAQIDQWMRESQPRAEGAARVRLQRNSAMNAPAILVSTTSDAIKWTCMNCAKWVGVKPCEACPHCGVTNTLATVSLRIPPAFATKEIHINEMYGRGVWEAVEAYADDRRDRNKYDAVIAAATAQANAVLQGKD